MIVLLPYIDERSFSFLDEVRRQGSGRRAASIKRFIERLENNNSSDSDKPRKRKRKSSTKKKARRKQKKFSSPIGNWIRTGSIFPTEEERNNPSTIGMVGRGSLATGIAGAAYGALTGDATNAVAGGLLGAGVGAGLGLTAGALANRNN